MKRIRKLSLLIAFTFMIIFKGYAHSYWLELKGSGKVNEPVTVYLYFGEFEKGLRENKPYFLKNMETFSAWYIDAGGVKKDLMLVKDSNCYKATFIPDMNGTYTVMMKEDTRAVQDWKQHGLGIVRPIENVKAVYVAGKVKAKQIALFRESKVDIIQSGNNRFQLLINSAAVPNTAIAVTTQDGKQLKITTDATAVFSLPDNPGMILVDIDYKETKAGEYNGKPYEAVRYKYALTFYNKNK